MKMSYLSEEKDKDIQRKKRMNQLIKIFREFIFLLLR